jgi:hypothetical protein
VLPVLRRDRNELEPLFPSRGSFGVPKREAVRASLPTTVWPAVFRFISLRAVQPRWESNAYPVLMVKRSLVWSLTEWPLTIFATVRTNALE